MSWIQTYTGKKFNLLNPTPEMVCIEDIAHSLANQSRFNGHTRRFYSVAEHSLLVQTRVPKTLRLAALLHDAGEAYTGDIPAPLKALLGTTCHEAFDKIDQAICDHFGLASLEGVWIKDADMRMLFAERAWLLGRPREPWEGENIYGNNVETLYGEPLTPEEAKKAFLQRFDFLNETSR